MKSILKVGLITGLIAGIWVISSFTIGNRIIHALHLDIPATRTRAYSGLFSIIILLAGIYWGMQAVKKKNDFHISYAVAVKTGIIISLITGLIAGIFTFLYCTIINPGYADFMVREIQKTLTAAHAGTYEINQQLTAARKEFSTSSQVIMALVGQIVAGTIGSLIIGLFIRTKKSQQ